MVAGMNQLFDPDIIRKAKVAEPPVLRQPGQLFVAMHTPVDRLGVTLLVDAVFVAGKTVTLLHRGTFNLARLAPDGIQHFEVPLAPPEKAREALAPKANENGIVEFWTEVDDEVLWNTLEWHETSSTGDRAAYSAAGWNLCQSGELNEDCETIADILDFGDVYLSLADYKAGRTCPIEQVVNAARAHVGLPTLANDPEAVGPHEADADDDEE